MQIADVHPDWRMTVCFLLCLGILVFAMKLVVILRPSPVTGTRWSFLWSLLPALTSLDRSPVRSLWTQLFRVLAFGAAVLLSYWAYWQLVGRFQLRGVVLSYLAAPVLLLMGEFLAVTLAVLWLPSGRWMRALHNSPLLSRDLADFWGRRWNLWFSDWFRDAIFVPLRKRPVLALLLVFAISGLMHEWVVNVPLYIVTGRALFGSMMAYFLIQGLGILVERRFLPPHSFLRIVFTWIVVLGPVPFLLNEGLLRVLHLWTE